MTEIFFNNVKLSDNPLLIYIHFLLHYSRGPAVPVHQTACHPPHQDLWVLQSISITFGLVTKCSGRCRTSKLWRWMSRVGFEIVCETVYKWLFWYRDYLADLIRNVKVGHGSHVRLRDCTIFWLCCHWGHPCFTKTSLFIWWVCSKKQKLSSYLNYPVHSLFITAIYFM